MRKLASVFILSLSLITYRSQAQQLQTVLSEACMVSVNDVQKGFIVKKVWLSQYEKPTVRVSSASYKTVDNPVAHSDTALKVVLGMDRKRPFAIIGIPVFTANGAQQLASLQLDVIEKQPTSTSTSVRSTAKVTAAASVLATGSWYKIAVPSRGFYKIDYDFLTTKLKLSGSISSANVRLFGNGGVMLPEANAEARFDDLTENAIWVNDGGDGVIGTGDYFVFYANGPMGWDKDSASGQFIHRKNLFEDKSFYFLNFNQSAGLRVAAQTAAPAPNTTVSSFNDYQVLEEDLVNVGMLGKHWMGEELSQSKSFSKTLNFNLGGQVDTLKARVAMGARFLAGTQTAIVGINGQSQGALQMYFGSGSFDDVPLQMTQQSYTQTINSATAAMNLVYQPTSGEGKGYVDFVELNYRRALSFSNGLTFRDWRSVGAGRIAGYQLSNSNGNTQVWDVTNPLRPLRMNGALSGSTYSFSQEASRLHEFAAFDGSQYQTAEYIGTVANQNLHANSQQDYLIVTAPEFESAANKLADFHRERGLRVLVATTTQIYNEFASGSKDMGGIRDFARMFYDRAGTDTTQMPRYMLLLGDASFDYKGRISPNNNFVPVYESSESRVVLDAYCSDDYYGFLDSVENMEGYNLYNVLDIGVGRLPAKTLDEANDMVNKIIHYKSAASLGPWRLSNLYIGDNEDNAGPHLGQAEDMVNMVDSHTGIYNASKLYLDNMPMVSTPGGTRSPESNKYINDQIYKGSFLINYSGHGGTRELAHERILTIDDLNTWKNLDKLPFMVTATCDFSQFDRPDFVSAGERLALKKDGGAIAMITTTQAVYATDSEPLNLGYLNGQFARKGDGKWNSFGDAFRVGKNEIYSRYLQTSMYGIILNSRKFSLLGDPALQPDFPEHFVYTDSIVSNATEQRADTLSALGSYAVTGSVKNASGQLLSDFNGRVYITIYDKPRSISLITWWAPRTYNVRNNIVYKGNATVENGRFSVSFIAPKDINYDMGSGRISYYVENGTTDGAGLDTNVKVGGASTFPVSENKPPIVRSFMNDSLFRDGGLTGTNSTLFVILEDETGINVTGNAVGHDLVGILDENVEVPYILNDYYQTQANTYKRGFVSFPITGLTDGRHSLRVKAWDVNNNSGEGTVNFEVANGEVTKVHYLANYPNPFADKTHFRFEHNHPNETMRAQIYVYNTAGMLVKRLDENFTPTGSRSSEITWDGTGDNGAKLPSGVYVYKLMLSTEKGIDGVAYQKLVIVR